MNGILNGFQKLSLIGLFTFSALTQAGVLANPQAYYPEEFYSAVDSGLRGDALKTQLFDIGSKAHVPAGRHDILKPTCKDDDKNCYRQVILGYKKARTVMFGKIHLVTTKDGYGVLDVYCQELSTTKDFPSEPPGPDQIPSHMVMNTEHTWPQSRFSSAFDKEMQKSDLHILYPVLSNANSSRSNLKFGDVVTPVSQPCNLSKRGYTAKGGNETYFEPAAIHKGNAARAVFYFSVRYKLPISAEEEASLRAWHKADPVDQFERDRNEVVFEVQRDRNPFIDHPELADLISDF